MAALRPSTISNDSLSCLFSSLPSNSYIGFQRVNSSISLQIPGSRKTFAKIEETRLRILVSVKKKISFRSEAYKEYSSQELANNESNGEKFDNGSVFFNEMKDRFLEFKKDKYLKNLDHYQGLANAQAPKFLVIACADSRVCPSSILGFQPGEAFVVRNVGNLVPPYENGPSETNAALEFAVNSLEVQNILVIGHSRCGGIQALMCMPDEEDSSSFIRSWVITGKKARLNTKAVAKNFSFDQQCAHCEKESINCSFVNLLTYPWIEEKVSKGLLSIHGGYYNFINCTFEKWTLDYKGSSSKEEGHKHAIKLEEFWS